jgi:hypothetical protein
MLGPKKSLSEYLADRSSQFGELGGRVLRVDLVELGSEEATLHAIIALGEAERGRLVVFEHIRMDGDRPHRSKYAYGGYIDGEARFRYDRDPMGHPDMPHHKHRVGSQRRMECGRVTLHDAADELWEELATLDDDRDY